MTADIMILLIWRAVCIQVLHMWRISCKKTEASHIFCVNIHMLWVIPAVVCINTQTWRMKNLYSRVALSGITLTSLSIIRTDTVRKYWDMAVILMIVPAIIISVEMVLLTAVSVCLLRRCRKWNSTIRISQFRFRMTSLLLSIRIFSQIQTCTIVRSVWHLMAGRLQIQRWISE